MSEPRIYTGAEALALRADVLDVCKGCGTAWDFDRRRCAECDGTTVLFVRHRLPADLAASVAHHEAHAAGLESLLHTLASAALAAIGRAPSPEGTHPAEAAAYAVAQVRLFADDVTMARDSHFARATAAEAERDAALAHAAELERALRHVTSARKHAEAERDALRAIVEGRAEPPTDAEIAAHAKAGGAWHGATPHGLVWSDESPTEARRKRTLGLTARWWALDSAGRPCAWPVTEAPR